jgi:hypothetical protein
LVGSNSFVERRPSGNVYFQVLERIGAKQLMAQLRSFCDLLVVEFSKSAGSGHVSKYDSMEFTLKISEMFRSKQGCQIFLGTKYQNGKNTYT